MRAPRKQPARLSPACRPWGHVSQSLRRRQIPPRHYTDGAERYSVASHLNLPSRATRITQHWPIRRPFAPKRGGSRPAVGAGTLLRRHAVMALRDVLGAPPQSRAGWACNPAQGEATSQSSSWVARIHRAAPALASKTQMSLAQRVFSSGEGVNWCPARAWGSIRSSLGGATDDEISASNCRIRCPSLRPCRMFTSISSSI